MRALIRSTPVSIGLLLILLSPPTAEAGLPRLFARGTFYCSTSLNDTAPGDSCWGWNDSVELLDDGLHGDGAAGDFVYGATIVSNQPPGRHEWKIATSDWTQAYPSASCCALANAVLFTTQPDESIHFRVDLGDQGPGWQPFLAVSVDHATPPGAVLELMGSAPELGAWQTGVPLQHVGSQWQRVITLAQPGPVMFKFRVQGTWSVANFGLAYNNTQGEDGVVLVTQPNADILFQFDEFTGRIRAIELGVSPARKSSWGEVKVRYR